MASIRYTINQDGTIEKWFLEKDRGAQVALRKTPTPKFNCGLEIFLAGEVYTSAKAARAGIKEDEVARYLKGPQPGGEEA